MSEQELEDPKFFPAWCHVLTRAEDDNGVDAWSGRLHAIKEQVTRIESKLEVCASPQIASLAHSTCKAFGRSVDGWWVV